MLEVCNKETAAQRNSTREQQPPARQTTHNGERRGGAPIRQRATARHNRGDGGGQRHSGAATAATAATASTSVVSTRAKGWPMDSRATMRVCRESIMRRWRRCVRNAVCSVAVGLRPGGFSLVRGMYTRASDSPLYIKESTRNNRGTPVLHVHLWITRVPRQTHRVGMRAFGTVPDQIGKCSGTRANMCKARTG